MSKSVRNWPDRRDSHLFCLLLKWAHTIGIWIERRRQRLALAGLDDRLLADVGLRREQARREAAKPFWKR